MIVASITKTLQNTRWNLRLSQNVMRYSTQEDKPEPEIPENVLAGKYSAQYQPKNGKVYDKRPFKMRCEAGKIYSWCLCGQGHGQPLCDGTHKNAFLKISLRPIKFQVKKTGDYWICNCKQTSNRPFCDGTHLRDDVQKTTNR